MKYILYLLAGLLLFAAAGCVAGKAPLLPEVGGKGSSDEYRQRALTFEEQGEVQQAVFWWQVVLALHPEDEEVRARIASLLETGRKKAVDHYQQAQELAERGEWDKARHQAVIALRYNPNHPDALALINRDQRMISHQVQSGETLAGIAEKYFHDPGRAPVIAYFNDLPADTGGISPGKVLVFPRLPVSETVRQKPATVEKEARLAEARQEFKQKKYRKAIVLAEKIVQQDPEEQEAQFLLNESYLAIGNEHLRRKEFVKAETVLVKVAEEFPGLKEAMAELGRWKAEQAEEHYRQGVKYYLDEDLTRAIMEWSRTLEFDPDHARARENIEKTRAIQEKLRRVK